MFNNPGSQKTFRWLTLSDLTFKVTESTIAGLPGVNRILLLFDFFYTILPKDYNNPLINYPNYLIQHRQSTCNTRILLQYLMGRDTELH